MKYYEILKRLRENKIPKPTQNEVAKQCGMTQRKLSFIEKGITEPNMEDLKALCLYYNVSADYILGFSQGLPYPE